jgi:hypothetical protein
MNTYFQFQAKTQLRTKRNLAALSKHILGAILSLLPLLVLEFLLMKLILAHA